MYTAEKEKQPLVFFCKSYRGDLKRFKRFSESLIKHNPNNIPFYVSVPKNDLKLFLEETPGKEKINWIVDEDIVNRSPGGSLQRYHLLDGRLTQQIIKAEFWRMGCCENYVCFDSDCVVTRDVYNEDFLFDGSTPYTVIHQHKAFLEQALRKKKEKYLAYFYEESRKLKYLFNRSGVDYEFGPIPCIWSRSVWADLYDKTLSLENKTIWDALIEVPIEIRWYGEALLKHKSIDLIPIEPLMKVYLYHWQTGEAEKSYMYLNKIYIGVLYQSNWEFEMNAYGSKKSFLSNFLRRLKRRLD